MLGRCVSLFVACCREMYLTHSLWPRAALKTRSTLQTGTSEGKWEGDTITITEVADSVKGLSTATTKTVCTYAHARVAAAAGVLSSPKPVAADPNCQMRVALT